MSRKLTEIMDAIASLRVRQRLTRGGIEHVTYKALLSPELITVPKGVNLPPHAQRSLEQSLARFNQRDVPRGISGKEVDLPVEVEALKPTSPDGKTAETD